jgi:hypothetical protein
MIYETKGDVIRQLSLAYRLVALPEKLLEVVYKRKWMEDGKEHRLLEHDAPLNK